MSAIAGIARFDGGKPDPERVARMTAAMRGRGPDGVSSAAAASMAFGHCMLRTTPESLCECQPLASEDGSRILVMDGRVDDRDTLRRDLASAGARLRDESDAELVLSAYLTWGEPCVERLVGEFAFVIGDLRSGSLFGARDPLGTRFFYYHEGARSFVFASELAGVMASSLVAAKLNEQRLLDYLVEEYDRDDEVATFYEGVKRLPAGHAMRVTGAAVQTWRYWDPANLPAREFVSLDECAEAYLAQLRVVVRDRLRSTGPVGSMLSGGIDSSSLVGLVRKEFAHELRAPLKTFSLVATPADCSDAVHIEHMVRGGGLDSTVLRPAAVADNWRRYVERAQAANDPFALTQGFTDGLMYEAAAQQGCRVVFDGMAGDLYFYWYGKSLGLTGARLKALPAVLRAGRRHQIQGALSTFGWQAATAWAPPWLRRSYRAVNQRFAAQRSDYGLLSRGIVHDVIRANHRRRAQARGRLGDNGEQARHARNFTTGLLSFAHEVNGQLALCRGVEPRSPFSDRRMVEFALTMPLQAKLCADWYKHLARRSMKGILPEPVRWRMDIARHPGWHFYDGLVQGLANDRSIGWKGGGLGGTLSQWVDPGRIAKAVARHGRNRDANLGKTLLRIWVLERWMNGRFS